MQTDSIFWIGIPSPSPSPIRIRRSLRFKNNKLKVDLTSNLTNDRSISISFLHRTQWIDQFHQKHNKSVILITSQIKAINHKKHKYESKNADLDEINYKEVIKRFDYIPVDIRFAEIWRKMSEWVIGWGREWEKLEREVFWFFFSKLWGWIW